MKLEKEQERVRASCSELLHQLHSQETTAENVREAHEKEKEELKGFLEADKAEVLSQMQQKLSTLRGINSDLNSKVEAAQKTEEQLQLVTDELTQLKQEFVKQLQSAEELSKQCFLLEQKNTQLQDEAYNARNQVVDNLESERNHTEEKVIDL